MADIERSLLYIGLGFFSGLFLITRFSVLRPVDVTVSSAGLASLAGLSNSSNLNPNLLYNEGYLYSEGV